MAGFAVVNGLDDNAALLIPLRLELTQTRRTLERPEDVGISHFKLEMHTRRTMTVAIFTRASSELVDLVARSSIGRLLME